MKLRFRMLGHKGELAKRTLKQARQAGGCTIARRVESAPLPMISVMIHKRDADAGVKWRSPTRYHWRCTVRPMGSAANRVRHAVPAVLPMAAAGNNAIERRGVRRQPSAHGSGHCAIIPHRGQIRSARPLAWSVD